MHFDLQLQDGSWGTCRACAWGRSHWGWLEAEKRDLKTVSMTGSGGGSASTCVYGSHRVSPKNWHLRRFVLLIPGALLYDNIISGMHMLPGENVEKLEGAPNFRQVGKYFTFYLHQVECFFRLPASQYLELVSQQRRASSKCWRRRRLRCLLQTLTQLLLILLLFQLLPKGRHLLPTTRPGQSGSTCARNQSSMSMAALARQGSQTNLYFSFLPSQVSWWSAQEPWDPVLCRRAWHPSEALPEAYPGHFKGEQCEGKVFLL